MIKPGDICVIETKGVFEIAEIVRECDYGYFCRVGYDHFTPALHFVDIRLLKKIGEL